MEDRARFLELLGEVLEIAKTMDHEMTKEEIRQYFTEMELSEEQMKYICDYIREGRVPKEEAEGTEVKKAESAAKRQTEPRHLRMYRQELRSLKEHSEEERERMYREYLAGERTHKNSLIEANLKRVTKLARKYQNRGILLEEKSLLELKPQTSAVKACENFLDREIMDTLVLLVDEEALVEDHENTLIAKTALIHEATKELAKDLGRVATIQELSDYTKITEEEIRDVMGISQDAVSVGDGHDHSHCHHTHEDEK